MAKVTVYHKKGCSTCEKVIEFLEKKGHDLDLRDIENYPPPRSLLETHIDAKNVKLYLNTRSPSYRDHALKDEPPTKKGAIELMMRDPTLIKRPITVKGRVAVFGWDEDALNEL